ncbi:hypothetical protein CI238_10390, partial [Colletotrichum incanum]
LHDSLALLDDVAVDRDALADLLLAKDLASLALGEHAALGLEGGDLVLGGSLGRQPLLLGAAQAREQVLVLGDELAGGGDLALALALHALLVEDALAAGPNLGHTLHSLERLGDKVAVVPHRDVAPRAELEGAVDRHLLVRRGAVRLCPLELAGVTLHLELLVWRLASVRLFQSVGEGIEDVRSCGTCCG